MNNVTEILRLHAAWLAGDADGKRAHLTMATLTWANLREADLRGANLREANLRGANLRGANLREATLRGATLIGANLRAATLREANLTVAYLRDADLTEANLTGANLAGADLTGANLTGANLTGANLAGAHLTGADLTGATLPAYEICPPAGAFTAYKVVRDSTGQPVVCTLLIPADAKRTSSLRGRKCRASHVQVISGEGRSPTVGLGQRLQYKPGVVVRADKFDPDIRQECAPGIHFFMTPAEAAAWLPA